MERLLIDQRRSTEWQLKAACRETSVDIFITLGDDIDDEPAYPSPQAMWFCNQCSVRAECLEYALASMEYGIWGGTTTYQRRQLRRSRSRLSCPGCGGHDIVQEHMHELCLLCGVSWGIMLVS